MTKVAILGCGPTGLIAAHAVYCRGIAPYIFSKKRKSQLFGSQYLHNPIPHLVKEDEGEQVKYVNIGTPEEYRRKTHGTAWDGLWAPEEFKTEHMAWDIRAAYDRLWRRYSPLITDYQIVTRSNGAGVDYSKRHPYKYLLDDVKISQYDLVISSVPRRIWEVEGEIFICSEGWALGDAPESGKFVPFAIDDMNIICDGSDKTSYNRLSCVFGYKTVEWPKGYPQKRDRHGHIGPHPAASKFVKPLKYVPGPGNGRSNPVNQENWLHIGRFGRWLKGIVVTDAWDDVNNRLDHMGL